MLRLLILAIPIVFMPNALHLSFETGIPGMNMANLVFIVALLAVAAGPRDEPPFRRGALTPALFAYMAALVMGFAIAQVTMPLDLYDDIFGLKNYLFYPLLYFVYRNCRLDAAATRKLIILLMIVAAVAGVEAVREGLSYGFGHYSDSKRASGPFGVDYRNANRAGVFYAMFLPMFFAMVLFFRGQKLWRIAALASCAILALAIMATYSRQAYAIALVCLALLLLRKHLVLALLVAALTLPIVELLPESVTQRVEETEQTSGAGTQELDVSTVSRFEIWSGASKMWADYPGGVGLRRFPKRIGDYSAHAGMDAHNYYVLTLSELGPLGLLAVLYLLWRLWRLSSQVCRASRDRDPEAHALAIGFTATILAMVLGNLYGSPFAEGSVMANFWILCGLMERYATLKFAVPAAFASDTVHVAPAHGIAHRFPLAARISPGKYERPQ